MTDNGNSRKYRQIENMSRGVLMFYSAADIRKSDAENKNMKEITVYEMLSAWSN